MAAGDGSGRALFRKRRHDINADFGCHGSVTADADVPCLRRRKSALGHRSAVMSRRPQVQAVPSLAGGQTSMLRSLFWRGYVRCDFRRSRPCTLRTMFARGCVHWEPPEVCTALLELSFQCAQPDRASPGSAQTPSETATLVRTARPCTLRSMFWLGCVHWPLWAGNASGMPCRIWSRRQMRQPPKSHKTKRTAPRS